MMHRRAIPGWVWLAAALYGLSQPVLCIAVAHCAPEGAVATGLQIPDSAVFLECMELFSQGLHSPYATCKAAPDAQFMGMFPLIYGALGAAGRALGLDTFTAYGMANGLGAFAYLLAAYVFMRAAAPRIAGVAFLLFACSGGLGGVIYVTTGLLGLHTAANFDAYAHRFVIYELIEGVHLLPVLHLPRIYYTLPLAMCLWGCALALSRGGARGRSAAGAAALLLCGAFLNARVGVFCAGVLASYAVFGAADSVKARLRAVAPAVVAVGLGAAGGMVLFRTRLTETQNLLDLGNMNLWFSPYVCTAALHIVAIAVVLPGRLRGQAGATRLVSGAGLGYLGAFGALWFAYQVYWGNLLVARDGAVAQVVSDPALLGAVLGVGWAVLRSGREEHPAVPPLAGPPPSKTEPKRRDEWDLWDLCKMLKYGSFSWWRPGNMPAGRLLSVESSKGDLGEGAVRATDWIWVWWLGYSVLAISAFGSGWFLKFGPQRLAILLWLPLCLLTADALTRLQGRRPGLARSWKGLLVGCGAVSVSVALLHFQGPLCRAPGAEPFARDRFEYMRAADAALLARLGEGMVLAPRPGGDLVVRNVGNPVVFGIGSFNLSAAPYRPLAEGVARFFDPGTPDPARQAFAREWCVAWVYCPATWPAPAATRAQLDGAGWLERVASAEAGAVYRVRAEALQVTESSKR